MRATEVVRFQPPPTPNRTDEHAGDRFGLLRRFSWALVALMTLQAAGGLWFTTAYRDAAWITATWLGNDWVTLVVAVPLLILGLRRAPHSARGLLLWLASVAFALYNYAFYLFGAALNAFFPIYVVAVVLAAIVLCLGLAHIDPHRIADRFRPSTPTRPIGAALVFVGAGLAAVWLAMWAAYVFGGRPTPIAPDAFKIVAALDLCLMVPALIAGGVLIWKRRPWGFVIATLASIQGALYLLVLSTNTLVLIQRGLARSPGELPIWGPLTVVMAAAAAVLLKNVSCGAQSDAVCRVQLR